MSAIIRVGALNFTKLFLNRRLSKSTRNTESTLRSFKCCRSYTSSRLPFEINSDFSKDIVLFRFDNSTFYKLLGLFGMAQLFFWLYLAQFSYRNLKDVPTDANSTSKPFWRKINLGQNKYRYGITFLCMSVGYMVAIVSAFLPLRTISSIVLCKGGIKARILTYTPFGTTRKIEVPLNNISCQQSRHSASSNMTLKIKGRWFFFLIDRRGVFLQPKLFDHTVGLYRNLK